MNRLTGKTVGSFFRVFLRKRCPRLFRLLKRVYFNYRRVLGSYRLRKQLKQRPWKLTLGAGGLYDEGWIPTEIYELDISRETDWRKFFKPDSVDAMLAEHLWEHLMPDDAVLAATNCHKYMRPGGCLRIAVPDGYNPDPEYIERVKVGGSGPGADDHKALYTCKTLEALLARAGFTVRLVEYHDEAGCFHSHDRDEADGIVYRSARRGRKGQRGPSSSLIVDAHKAHAGPQGSGNAVAVVES